MPVIDPQTVPTYDGPDSAEGLGGPLGAFRGHAFGEAAGLTQLGANVEVLAPGSKSSHRHWHSHNDEIGVVLAGDLTLAEDDGDTPMSVGSIACFKAGAPNGHQLINRSDQPATFLVVGSRDPQDRCHYADFDAVRQPDGRLTRADGTEINPEGEGER